MIHTKSSLEDDTFNLPPSLCLGWNALQMNAKEQQFGEVILRAWTGPPGMPLHETSVVTEEPGTMKGVCAQSRSTVNGQFTNSKFY